MGANPKIEPCSEAIGDVTESVYFDSGKQRLFGWLHRPSAPHKAGTGLVICKPFGYESICSHRSVRTFAESAAALGMPVLRFDYLGTGDSADIDAEADQITVWSQDVISAIAELQRRTGVQRVCLLGFRIGALLSALVAARCDSVAGLILVAPIFNGRRYVKELRTTWLAGLLSASGPAAESGGLSAGARKSVDGLEVSGFPFSTATLATLGKTDLGAMQARPQWGTLIIDNATLPGARDWADGLTRAGAKVTYKPLPGMVEMLMTAPQFAVVPGAMITAMREWLAEKIGGVAGPRDQAEACRAVSRAGLAQNVLTLPVCAGTESRQLTERAVRFGPDCVLFGVVTEPPREERRRRAVILLNAGVDQHIGASRLYVSLARRWASRGYVVLRMDFAGIGDSDTRPGAQNDDVFPASALDDIRTAIDYLKDRYAVVDMTLAGLCSGGYHALRAAAAGILVTRILMINPQNYFWKDGMSLTDLQAVEVLRNPGVYRQQVVSTAAWKRLLTGEVNVARIVKVYIQRISLAMLALLRDLARRLHIRLPDDLGRELEDIAARGIGIVFVFARGEPGFDLLKLECGRSFTRLSKKCRIHILPDGDHVFSHRHSRDELERVLSDELSAPGVLSLQAGSRDESAVFRRIGEPPTRVC
jgi:dienelactone hydrolase